MKLQETERQRLQEENNKYEAKIKSQDLALAKREADLKQQQMEYALREA